MQFEVPLCSATLHQCQMKQMPRTEDYPAGPEIQQPPPEQSR